VKTIDDLRTINSDAIDQMEKTVEEVDNLLDDPNINLTDESRLISRRATLQAQINNQKLIQAHLRAGAVIVDFSASDDQNLDQLADKMDKFIIQGLKINAMLGLVQDIIDTATEIGNSVNSHTGQSG
jgi:hypothetical protein